MKKDALLIPTVFIFSLLGMFAVWSGDVWAIDEKIYFQCEEDQYTSSPGTTFDLTTISNVECKRGGVNRATLTITAVGSGTAGITVEEDAELIVMRNVKINPNNTFPANDPLHISFWRAVPGTATGNAEYEARGGGYLKRSPFQAAKNGGIFFRGYLDLTGDDPNGSPTNEEGIPNTNPPPSDICPPPIGEKLVKCVGNTFALYRAPFYWNVFKKSSTITVATGARTLKGDLWLTFENINDYLELKQYSTNGLQIWETSGGGADPGDEACEECQGDACLTCLDYVSCPIGEGCPAGTTCVKCTPKEETHSFCRNFDWFCPTLCPTGGPKAIVTGRELPAQPKLK